MSQQTDNGQKSLEQWRQEIDILDGELLRLLNERARLAFEVGALKVSSGLPVYDGRRERQILARLCQSNQGPLGPESISSIFRCIIRESRRLERNLNEEVSNKSQSQQTGQEYGNGR
jgi:chorismate mutase-like protein